MQSAPTTMSEAIEKGRQRLNTRNVQSARLDAELLLCHCLGLDRSVLYTSCDQPLSVDDLRRYEALIARRACREPLAYIVGFREFWSLKIMVTHDVLIPRPETEALVETALQKIHVLREGGVGHPEILEIGLGSGAVSIALAKECKPAVMIGVDISLHALHVARTNICTHGVADTVMPVCGDCCAPFRPGAAFDLIVANPPYIATGEFRGLEPEITQFEPRCALDGGEDGLDFYRGWTVRLALLLRSGAWIVMEVDAQRADQVVGIVNDAGLFDCVTIQRDFAGRNRVVFARRTGQCAPASAPLEIL